MADQSCPLSLPGSALFACIVLLILLSSYTASSTILTAHEDNDFLECISFNAMHTKLPVYTPNTTSYTSILESRIQNLRFSSTDAATPNKPRFIVTPSHESHVQVVLVCSRKHDLRSEFEVEAMTRRPLVRSNLPFVLIDLFNLRTIDVNIKDDKHGLKAGATLGEVYYRIAREESCSWILTGKIPTIGVGGHIGGAGHGTFEKIRHGAR
ncbi:hypothetical protein Sjap_017781 [Stephania japonica]|uniref:Uncharacterized protein n=1 Tax=Stephania japonica TaxID=461633 RepID=A0AAP0NMF1_9MAGN